MRLHREPPNLHTTPFDLAIFHRHVEGSATCVVRPAVARASLSHYEDRVVAEDALVWFQWRSTRKIGRHVFQTRSKKPSVDVAERVAVNTNGSGVAGMCVTRVHVCAFLPERDTRLVQNEARDR